MTCPDQALNIPKRVTHRSEKHRYWGFRASLAAAEGEMLWPFWSKFKVYLVDIDKEASSFATKDVNPPLFTGAR